MSSEAYKQEILRLTSSTLVNLRYREEPGHVATNTEALEDWDHNIEDGTRSPPPPTEEFQQKNEYLGHGNANSFRTRQFSSSDSDRDSNALPNPTHDGDEEGFDDKLTFMEQSRRSSDTPSIPVVAAVPVLSVSPPLTDVEEGNPIADTISIHTVTAFATIEDASCLSNSLDMRLLQETVLALQQQLKAQDDLVQELRETLASLSPSSSSAAAAATTITTDSSSSPKETTPSITPTEEENDSNNIPSMNHKMMNRIYRLMAAGFCILLILVVLGIVLSTMLTTPRNSTSSEPPPGTQSPSKTHNHAMTSVPTSLPQFGMNPPTAVPSVYPENPALAASLPPGNSTAGGGDSSAPNKKEDEPTTEPSFWSVGVIASISVASVLLLLAGGAWLWHSHWQRRRGNVSADVRQEKEQKKKQDDELSACRNDIADTDVHNSKHSTNSLRSGEQDVLPTSIPELQAEIQSLLSRVSHQKQQVRELETACAVLREAV